MSNSIGKEPQTRLRIPRPVPKNWKKGIKEVREQAPPELVHSEQFDWPQRSELVEIHRLREFIEHCAPSTDEEVVTHAEMTSQDLGDHFEGMLEYRIYATRALRAFMHWVFDRYAPENNLSVMEMGCGPELLLYEVAPPRLKRNWHAFDVEPAFVRLSQEKARLFKLPVEVDRRSIYRPFHQQSQIEQPDLWVGLSSYDAVDVSLALRGMNASSGTRFIHIQDLYPGVDPILHFERKHPERRVKWLVRQSAAEEYGLMRGFDNMHNFFMNRERQLYFELDGKLLSPADEFHDRLVFCLQAEGFNIINHGVALTAYSGVKTPDHMSLFSRDEYQDCTSELNAYLNFRGDYSAAFIPKEQDPDADFRLPYPGKNNLLEVLVANFVVAEKA